MLTFSGSFWLKPSVNAMLEPFRPEQRSIKWLISGCRCRLEPLTAGILTGQRLKRHAQVNSEPFHDQAVSVKKAQKQHYATF